MLRVGLTAALVLSGRPVHPCVDMYNAFAVHNITLEYSFGNENNLQTEMGQMALTWRYVSRLSYMKLLVTLQAARGPCFRCLSVSIFPNFFLASCGCITSMVRTTVMIQPVLNGTTS